MVWWGKGDVRPSQPGGYASKAVGIVAETGSSYPQPQQEVAKALYLEGPSDIHPPTSLHNLKPPQMAPPFGNQFLRYTSLQVTFLLKLP